MREYGQVQCSFWSDPDVQRLSDHGKLLFLYLLTGPHSNGLGCYRIPDGYVQADLGWSLETVSKGFGELFREGFVERCEETFFMVIPGFLRWNPITNGNIAAARVKEFDSIPKRSKIFPTLINSLLVYGKHFSEEFLNRIETISKGLPKGYSKQDPTRPDPDPDPDPDPNQRGEGYRAPTSRRSPPATTPRAAKSAETWNAYAAAYFDRYGVEPVRNAKVNAQLSQLVDRLGAKDAPAVAAWFVSHNAQWYVTRGHSVDALLADSEKLRTEWATGRRVTQTAARQTDRKQHHMSIAEQLIAENRAREVEHGE